MRARRKLGILENILISLGAGAAILGCDGGPVDNRPPEITNQTVLETPEEEPLEILTNNLVVEDPDNIYPDDFTLTVLDGSNYTHVGNIITPIDNFNGNLTVPVVVNDGMDDSSQYNLTVGVTPVNDAPEITNQTVLETPEEEPLEILTNNLVVEDPDNIYPDDFTLTVLDGSNYTHVGNIITPIDNFNGNLTVPVVVNDGMDDSSQYNLAVGVTPVNDAPVAQNDNYTVQKGSSDNVLTVLANDSDQEGSISIKEVTQPANGSADIVDNKVIFKPDADFFGSDSFDYTIEDSEGLTDSAVVNLNVNSAPVWNINIDDDNLNEDFGSSIHVNDLSNYVNDADGDVVSFNVQNENPSEVDSGISGNQLILNSIQDWNGSSSITIRANDGNGGVADDNFLVNVAPVNDTPAAINDVADVDEDNSVLIDALANDSDVEDGKPSLDSIVTSPSNGTAIIEGNQIRYTPNENFNGNDSFSYKVRDSWGLTSDAGVSVNVNPVNDIPLTENDIVAVIENNSILIDVLGNDSDVEDGKPEIVDIEVTPNQGSAEIDGDQVRYTPYPNFKGIDSFTYRVIDLGGATASAKVDIGVSEDVTNKVRCIYITNNALKNSTETYTLDDLLTLNEEEGNKSIIVTTEEIAGLGYSGTTEEQIDQFLEDVIDDPSCDFYHPEATHACLVGDVSVIPPILVTCINPLSGLPEDVADDSRFFCRGNKLTYMLKGGRLPAETVQELNDIIGKIVDYRKGNVDLNGYIKDRKLLFHAAKLSDGNDGAKEIDWIYKGDMGGIDFRVSGDNVKRFYEEFGSFPGSLQATRAGILEALTLGEIVAFFYGHGSGLGIEINQGLSEALDVNDMGALDLTGKYPLGIIVGCSTGKFDQGDCFAERGMLNPKGLIGCFASSRTGLMDNTPGLSESWEVASRLIESIYGKGIHRLSDAFVNSKESHLIFYEYDETNIPEDDEWVYRGWMFFGDPMMKLRTNHLGDISVNATQKANHLEVIVRGGTEVIPGNNPLLDNTRVVVKDDLGNLYVTNTKDGIAYLPKVTFVRVKAFKDNFKSN